MKTFIKDMTYQLKSMNFDGSRPIAILNFLAEFRRSCDTNRVHEGAAFHLFSNFIRGTAIEDLRHNLTGPGHNEISGDGSDVEGDVEAAPSVLGRLTSYCEVVQYLLFTYATDDVIAEAHSDLQSFKQAPNVNPVAYSNQLLTKVARCGHVYSPSTLRAFFVEGVHENIREAVRGHLSLNPKLGLHQLARYTNSMSRISRVHSTPVE